MTFTEFIISVGILSVYSFVNLISFENKPKMNDRNSQVIEINNKITFDGHIYKKNNKFQFVHDSSCTNSQCQKRLFKKVKYLLLD